MMAQLSHLSVYHGLTWLPKKLYHGARIIRRHGIKVLAPMVHTVFPGKQPLVSFVLPVYNVELYLEQCLDSLLNQSLQAIEIICVDDGSTDSSLEILRRYADKDSRIQVYTQKNQFAGVARNLGLRHAQGKYVIFLDSDDFFHRDLAREAYFAAEANHADVVLYDAQLYDNLTGTLSDSPHFLNRSVLPEKPVFSYKDCKESLFRLCAVSPWTKAFRRSFILEHKLQFQPLHNANDLYFTTSALCCARRITALELPLVYYRVGLTTNLQSKKSRYSLCFYEALAASKEKIYKIGAEDTLHTSFLNLALSHSLSNLHTIDHPEAKRGLYEQLRSAVFPNLGLTDCPRSLLTNPIEAEELDLIVAHSFDEYLEIRETAALAALKSKQHTGEDLTHEETTALREAYIYQELARREAYRQQQRPLISLCIPVYNVEKYLAECLDSVLNQTFEDIEILCVDDGSSDGSPAILQEYAQKDTRIRVITKEKNNGLLSARKTAVEAARGAYLVFLDSDDFIAPDLCTFVSQITLTEFSDIIQYTVKTKNYSDNEEMTAFMDNILAAKETRLVGTAISAEAYITRSFTTSLLGKIYRAEMCKKAYSLLPHSHCYVGEDIISFFYLAYFAESFRALPTPGYYFYRYGLGVTGNSAMPLTTFERYCKMAECSLWAYEAIVEKCELPIIEEAYQSMRNRMASDCCVNYGHRLAPADWPAGLEILCSYWDGNPVLESFLKDISAPPPQPGLFKRAVSSLKTNGIGGTLRKVWNKIQSR